jgi:hypothetical protein
LDRILPVACAVALCACGAGSGGSHAAASARAAAGATLAPEPFSGERAWAHLVALADLGPRPSGSPASQEALEYIRSRLADLDLEVLDLVLDSRDADQDDSAGAASEAEKPESSAKPVEASEPPGPGVTARHLVARIPGASPDSIMLLAHYDTLAASPGANDGASGAAVLLELARQIKERPLPYTTEIVFLDHEMAVDEKDPTTPLLQGSWLLADHLRDSGTLPVLRLAVFFRQVGDADLTVGRDLHSHRIFREAFFEAAADLGLESAFPTERGFVEVTSSHRPFVQLGMPRVVSIMDPWYGGEEPPGTWWGGEADTVEHCAPGSLRTVGVVSLAALRRISAQLERIDRLSGRAARREAEAAEPPAEAAPAPFEPAGDEPSEAPAEPQPEAPAEPPSPAPEASPESS